MNTKVKSSMVGIGISVALFAAFILSTPAYADNWQDFSTPLKTLGVYELYGTDSQDLSPTNQYCPNYLGAYGNGCWQVKGSTDGDPIASSWDTQEVGEDRCTYNGGSTSWINGPNTGHSYSQSAGPSLGPIVYDCSGYPNPYHQYCLKSYHRAQWGGTCNTGSECILENSFVLDSGTDTSSNPGC